MLVQEEAKPASSNVAMQKYLDIAKQLVKLDKSLPNLKLCMADV